MRDPVTLLHANGWHMKTVSEPLAEARERIAANGGGKVTSVRRLQVRSIGRARFVSSRTAALS